MGEIFRVTYSPEQILAEMERYEFREERFIAAIHVHKDAILPRLIAVASTAFGRRGVHACAILLELGDIAGSKGLTDRVSGTDAEARQNAIRRLLHLKFDSELGGYQVPLDRPAVFAAIVPLLKSTEKQLFSDALGILQRLQLPEADMIVASYISHLDPQIRTDVAAWLAKRGEDQGALDVIDDLLLRTGQDSHIVYWLVSALEDLCRKGGADAKARACRLATQFIHQNLKRTDNATANHLWHCLRAVAHVQPWGEAALLEEVLASPAAWWVRGEALKRLGEVEGAAGLERLCAALKDIDLRKPAAEKLGELAKRTDDKRIIAALGEAMETETAPSALAMMAKAFLAAGGGSRALLRRVMARSEPGTAMMLHWVLKGIGPRQVADLLVTTGMAMPSNAEIAEYETRWEADYDAIAVLFPLLYSSGSVAGIMIKTVDSVPDHAVMIADLCNASCGAFAVEDLHQTITDDAELVVGFSHSGVPYRLSFDRLGRYLDLASALDGLNEILEKIGHKSRFFQIHDGGGDSVTVIFAFKVPFLKAARKLRIPIETDHDAGRRLSIAYTAQVLKMHS